jgi:hypothetical protein
MASIYKEPFSPSSPRRGGRDTNQMPRSYLLGAAGVVIKFQKIFW